ncbi:MAG: T9SS type A sorting domain-containing protein, partial [candidate division Zixibacteria bacterium]
IHVVCRDYNSDNSGYSVSADNGELWERYEIIYSTDILSGVVCTSPVSSKTAVIYTLANSNGYDVIYFEAPNGDDWDWGSPVNITNFTPSDEMSAWSDIDGIYDHDDNLHILYQGQLADADGVYVVGELMHWSAAAGHSSIASSAENCLPSNYNNCICKMSLGVNPDNGNIFALWAELNEEDASAAGYSNGELYAAGSVDGGATWGPKVNLTNSPTPGCSPPNCDSDIYSSLAEKVDGTLHIMYVDDDDAGAEWNGEGGWTDNNVLYLAIDEGDLIPLSVDENVDLPFEFDLSQNYPNPFNANTVITVDGDFDSGTLAIYNIAGRLVNNFAIKDNNRTITWDGTDLAGEVVASGTYFYSVNVDGFGTASVKKMTLLK